MLMAAMAESPYAPAAVFSTMVATLANAPLFYVRGNHELRGRFARHLRDYLPLQDGRYYGAVTAGAARFVFLDTGESENGDTAKNAGLFISLICIHVNCSRITKAIH